MDIYRITITGGEYEGIWEKNFLFSTFSNAQNALTDIAIHHSDFYTGVTKWKMERVSLDTNKTVVLDEGEIITKGTPSDDTYEVDIYMENGKSYGLILKNSIEYEPE